MVYRMFVLFCLEIWNWFYKIDSSLAERGYSVIKYFKQTEVYVTIHSTERKLKS